MQLSGPDALPAGPAEDSTQLRERMDRLALVVRAQQDIATAGPDLDAVMAAAARHARELSGAGGAVVELSEGDEMVYRGASGAALPHLGLRLAAATSISGLCVRTGEVILCDDSEVDPRVNREACRRVGARSLVVVPLVCQARTVGVLKVYSQAAGAFDVDDVQALRLLTALLASAMDTAQKFGTIRELLESRERAEAALRESEERYRSIFQGAEEGFFLVERTAERGFRYLDMNAALTRITGIRRDAFVGRTPEESFPPETAARVAGLYRGVFETGAATEVEHTNQLPRGAVTTRTRLHPLRDGGGATVRVLGIVEDATERLAAQATLRAYATELERSNRELQDFAYVASHDLQEPLRKIQAFGDRLRDRCAGSLDSTGRDYLDRMQGAAARMQALIQDLLAYSRVTSKAAAPVAVDLGAVAVAVVSDLQARIEETGGEVHLGDLPRVSGDAMQLRQLLQNLIGNALKFHRAGVPPVVRVAAEAVADAGEVRVRVSDNGIGFEVRYLDRIFSPFQRLHGRAEYEGTGMGLAICRRIVERHGGTITAESTPGEGATFVLTLPLTPGSER